MTDISLLFCQVRSPYTAAPLDSWHQPWLIQKRGKINIFGCVASWLCFSSLTADSDSWLSVWMTWCEMPWKKALGSCAYSMTESQCRMVVLPWSYWAEEKAPLLWKNTLKYEDYSLLRFPDLEYLIGPF